MQITTAVNFLKNPKVARSSVLQKRNFLAAKGLTEQEIQEAFERVGIFSNVNVNSMEEAMDEIKINIPPYKYTKELTTFEKIKDVLSSMALISGIAYGVYMFYKVNFFCTLNFFFVSYLLILIQLEIH